MKNKTKLLIFIFVGLLLSFACGNIPGSNTGTLIEPDQTEEIDDNPSPDLAEQDFTVGDIVEIDNFLIALKSIDFQGDLITADFIIKNIGNNERVINPLVNFRAKNEQSALLEQQIFACPPDLGGSLVNGDIIFGKICWKSGSLPIRIYFDPGVFKGTIVWDITKIAESEVALNPDELDSYKTGDSIELNNLFIRLVETKILNGKLTATFDFENIGTSELYLNSGFSLNAKSLDGRKFERLFFGCEAGIDDSLVVGDKITGSICWNNASYPLMITFDESPLTNAAFIWKIIGE